MLNDQRDAFGLTVDEWRTRRAELIRDSRRARMKAEDGRALERVRRKYPDLAAREAAAAAGEA